MDGPLQAEALRQHAAISAGGSGIQRSNMNGGFHGEEQMFRMNEGFGVPPWYSRLHGVIAEALTLVADGVDGSVTIDGLPLDALSTSGWLNVSGEHAFNAVHDHGEVLWSFVYFVSAGQRPTRELGGSLLLQTEVGSHQASHEFGYLAVEPTKGELWAFPGYMKHAVLPRGACTSADHPAWAASAARTGAYAPPEDSRRCPLRISAACNVCATVMHDAKALVDAEVAGILAAKDAAARAMAALRSGRRE